MEKTNDEYTFAEWAALAVRKLKSLLVWALIGAVLMGGWRSYKAIKAIQDSTEETQKKYEEKLEAFQKKKADAERQLALTETQLENQQRYLDNSLLMKLNPYDMYLTTISYAVMNTDTSRYESTTFLQQTVEEYVTKKIQMQYGTLWTATDLQEVVPVCSDTPDKYIREVLSLTASDSGLLTIRSYANDPDTSQQMAEALAVKLEANRDIVAETAFGHDLVRMTKITKPVIDPDIFSSQQTQQKLVTNYIDSIYKQQQTLEAMEEPEAPITKFPVVTVLKSALIGAVGGLLLGYVLLLFYSIVRGSLFSADQMERCFMIPQLGAAAEQSKLVQVADAMLGEQNWKDPAEAAEYAVRRVGEKTPEGGSITLLSSLTLSENDEKAALLMKALREAGYSVTLCGRAAVDPKAVEQVRTADTVCLLERKDKTRKTHVYQIMEMTERQERKAAGFILI